MPLRPGEVLGRYVIDGVIGHGGMGSVYSAQDTRLHRRVALKVLAADPAEAGTESSRSTGGSARILREARIAARLEHPNVVGIYDVDEITEGENAGLAYLAMELVEGRSLRACVGDATIPIATRLRWLTEIARGLAAAHDGGLVHRDVKPENVVVRADGVAKILDFGIAKQLSGGNRAAEAVSPRGDSVTREGALAIVMPMGAQPALSPAAVSALGAASITGEGIVVGTPYYMSPEQMKGNRVDARTDQFSWGVMAYELLSGVPPWGTQLAPVHVVAAILGTDPPNPHEANPAVAEWLGEILLRAMAKSADARFASMHEVIARLEMGESGAPAKAGKGPPAGAAAAEWRGRLRKAAPWLFATLALGVGVGVARLAPSVRPAPLPAPAPAPATIGGCTSTTECAKRAGAPSICVRSACVALDSVDCHVKADPAALASDATLWIGSMYPLIGPAAEEGIPNERATDLARQDFAGAAAGLRGGGDKVRPIGLVSCDDAADSERAARHLVDDLSVAAVVGFRDGDEVVELASSLFGPRHVLAVATLSTSPLVTQIPHAQGDLPLVWRATYSLSEDALALSALVETVVEPQLRAQGAPRTRVALLRAKSPGTLAFSERLFDALRFNGASALDNGNDYQEIILDLDAPPEAYAVALARLRDFAPSIVIYTGGQYVPPILEPLERGWRGGKVRPRYVTTLSLDEAAVAMVGSSADLRGRVFGVTLQSTTATNARFTLHYNGVYGTSLSRPDAPSTAYDGFYLVAYASLAMGGAPATGASLAAAIAKLVPPGPLVEVGPAAIFQAFTTLRSGGSIDLVGAGGPLDFDLHTGEQAADLSILCVDVDKHGKAIGSLESGLVYSPKAAALVGKMRCP